MKFHHIGIVCDIKFLKKIKIDNKIDCTYIDKFQKNKLLFYFNKKNKILYEFIFPINKFSTTFNFLKKNGPAVHHYGFEVKNLDKVMNIYKNKKDYVFINSYSAKIACLGGKVKTCFFYFKKNIVEFIEIKE